MIHNQTTSLSQDRLWMLHSLVLASDPNAAFWVAVNHEYIKIFLLCSFESEWSGVAWIP